VAVAVTGDAVAVTMDAVGGALLTAGGADTGAAALEHAAIAPAMMKATITTRIGCTMGPSRRVATRGPEDRLSCWSGAPHRLAPGAFEFSLVRAVIVVCQ